jgi:predicted ferric reductase
MGVITVPAQPITDNNWRLVFCPLHTYLLSKESLPMTRTLYAIFWITIYLVLTLAPLFILLVGEPLPGRSFIRELSVAFGFAGLAMMGLQFLLTARYKSVTSPYGVDVIYHFHRQISLVAFALILSHPLLLIIENPAFIRLFNIFTAPWQARYGVLALFSLALLIGSSIWRIKLRIPYDPWRISHGIFATAAVVLAMGHVIGAAYYLNTPAKQAIWLALGGIWISALLFIRIIKPLWMLRRPYVIEDVRPERGNTWSMRIRPDGHKGLRFNPGQFAWLTVWSSPFAISEHPFSFSSSAVHPERFELAIKELGDFTSKVPSIKPGTRAYIDGPYGVFSIDNAVAPGYIFLAGGIGISPIMSMLRTMADRCDLRPIHLFYGNRTWENMTFREEIEFLKNRLNLHVVYILDNPPDGWQGESGFITAEMLARHLPINRMELQYFICGPDLMMNAVEEALERLGLSLEQTHAERFNLV